MHGDKTITECKERKIILKQKEINKKRKNKLKNAVPLCHIWILVSRIQAHLWQIGSLIE